MLKTSFTRRQLSYGLLLGGLTCWGDSRYVEPHWLDVSSTTVSFFAKGNAAGQTVRILHLADLHLSKYTPLPSLDEAFAAGLALKPHLACLTGDFITANEPYDRDAYREALRRLAQTLPVFACLGNHDGGVWAMTRHGHRNCWVIGELLEESGIQVLHNRSEPVEVAGRRFRLTGLGDLWGGEADPASAFRAGDDLPTIVLAHNPDTKDLIANFPWQLMLSGHTHGGQVVLPVVGPCFAPVKDRRFIAGLYRWNERRLFITRGVGNLGGYRFRCRPEASILELV